MKEAPQLLSFRAGQGSPVSGLGERLQPLQIRRLRRLELRGALLQPLANLGEERMDRMFGELFVRPLHTGSHEVSLFQSKHTRRGRQFRVFLLEGVEIGMLHEIPFGAFEEHESAQHLLGDLGAERQLVPQTIEFPILIVG